MVLALQEFCPEIGLELNLKKCELWWPSTVSIYFLKILLVIGDVGCGINSNTRSRIALPVSKGGFGIPIAPHCLYWELL